MSLIIQKFGGTSVANTERIKKIVPVILQERSLGNDVIVVVSAMSGITNRLVTLCNEISNLDSDDKLSECDVSLSTGEMVTSSLLALALKEQNVPAVSVLSWQLPIFTDNNYGKALVKSVNVDFLESCLRDGIIPIIAGFQGIDKSNRLTTLGRGGSDTTAAIIAAKMQAQRCDIYTDVAGIFTADPRIIHKAKKIDIITFEEMLEFASAGAKVLHSRAAEIAMRYNINIRILSSFLLEHHEQNYTLITSKANIMEQKLVTGITSNKNLLEVRIIKPFIDFTKILSEIVRHNIFVDFMTNDSDGNYKFITSLIEKPKLELLFGQLKKDGKLDLYEINTQISMVSIIGYGIKNDHKLTNIILQKLIEENIEVTMMQSSEIKLSMLINDIDTERTIIILHGLLE